MFQSVTAGQTPAQIASLAQPLPGSSPIGQGGIGAEITAGPNDISANPPLSVAQAELPAIEGPDFLINRRNIRQGLTG